MENLEIYENVLSVTGGPKSSAGEVKSRPIMFPVQSVVMKGDFVRVILPSNSITKLAANTTRKCLMTGIHRRLFRK